MLIYSFLQEILVSQVSVAYQASQVQRESQVFLALDFQVRQVPKVCSEPCYCIVLDGRVDVEGCVSSLFPSELISVSSIL